MRNTETKKTLKDALDFIEKNVSDLEVTDDGDGCYTVAYDYDFSFYVEADTAEELLEAIRNKGYKLEEIYDVLSPLDRYESVRDVEDEMIDVSSDADYVMEHVLQISHYISSIYSFQEAVDYLCYELSRFLDGEID